MSRRFDSARSKLARAEAHRKSIEPEIKCFVESDPITLRSRHNLGGVVGPIRFAYSATGVAPIPVQWAAVAGDAIQNIRAALDHGIWAIVVKAKGVHFAESNAPKIDFPITDQPSRFPKKRLALLGISPPLIAVIEQAQPYARNQGAPRDDVLWLLRTLSNVDKHRLLHVVAMVPEEVMINTTPFLVNGNVEIVNKGVIKKGAELVCFTASRPSVRMKVEVSCEFRAGICIEATSESRAVAIDTGLRGMHERAAEIIATLDPGSRTARRRKR
jgi:hypothetical protein